MPFVTVIKSPLLSSAAWPMSHSRGEPLLVCCRLCRYSAARLFRVDWLMAILLVKVLTLNPAPVLPAEPVIRFPAWSTPRIMTPSYPALLRSMSTSLSVSMVMAVGV